jgi:hypothetical protein
MIHTRRHHTTSLDNAVLEHIARYRLTVLEAIHTIPQLRNRSRNDTSRIVRQLEATGLISSAWLYADRRYYAMTPTGADSTYLGSRRVDTRSEFSEESKLRYFAMLSYCCLGGTQRQRLLPDELTRRVTGTSRFGPSGNYYIEPDERAPKIGFVRVDMSGIGRWDRVLAKCLQDARDHALNPAWASLNSSGLFQIALVTALPQKAERICRELNALQHPPPVPIRVTAIPELLYLVAPPPR